MKNRINISLKEVIEYAIRGLLLTSNASLREIPEDMLVDVLASLGIGRKYTEAVTTALMNDVPLHTHELPYAKIHKDAHGVLTLTESYLSIPLCRELYRTKHVMTVESHYGQQYISALVRASGSVYCRECGVQHPRTPYWYNDYVVNSDITAAECIVFGTGALELPAPNELQ